MVDEELDQSMPSNESSSFLNPMYRQTNLSSANIQQLKQDAGATLLVRFRPL